jgi:Flp pilus assembly protein TadB
VAAPVASRSERRRQRKSGVRWKAVATVVLLCALGAAVTVVLLQSAGLISWGFLGPTA